MIVTGAQMAVTTDTIGARAARSESSWRASEADYTIHDVGARLLQPVRQFDVRFLIEARPQLDDDGDVFAGERSGQQCIHDRRIIASAIQRLFDRQHFWIAGRLTQQIHHRHEAAKGVVQQHVALSDHREQIRAAPGRGGNPGREGDI